MNAREAQRYAEELEEAVQAIQLERDNLAIDLADLKRQRDELLAALEAAMPSGCLAGCKARYNDTGAHNVACRLARKAIANAEKGGGK